MEDGLDEVIFASVHHYFCGGVLLEVLDGLRSVEGDFVKDLLGKFRLITVRVLEQEHKVNLVVDDASDHLLVVCDLLSKLQLFSDLVFLFLRQVFQFGQEFEAVDLRRKVLLLGNDLGFVIIA